MPTRFEALSQAAAVLGRRGARKGGLARASVLAPHQRREIARQGASARWGGQLPASLSELFWEYDFDKLRLPADDDIVFLKVLTRGSSAHRRWLVRRAGAKGIRRWIMKRRGRGLDEQQMRHWGIPAKVVQTLFSENPSLRIWSAR